MNALTVCAAILLWSSSAAAQDSCRVRGRLLGHDGKAMRGAFLRTYGPGTSGTRPAVHQDGSFTAVFPRPGGYFFAVAGVHHKTWFLPLLLERPGTLEVELRLSTADYAAAFDSVRVIGDFNDFATEGAVPMARRPDGTLVATVASEKDSLRYQLLGVQAHGYPLCGTQADAFVVDRKRPLIEGRSSSFVSALETNRRPARIVFDPAGLPRGTSSPSCSFADSLGTPGRIVAVNRDAKWRAQRRTDAYLAFKSGGGAPDSFVWDPTPDLKDLMAQLDRERNPMVRGFLLLTCVQLAPGDIDSTLAQRILAEIPPDSPLWSLVWGGPENTFGVIARAAGDSLAEQAYAERVVEAHQDSSVRAGFLYGLLYEAHRAGDLQRAGRYYTRMTSEFPQHFLAAQSRKQFAPNRAISAGKAAPDFAFGALDDSTRVYRPAQFRGKYLLIDFWATWCGPCVAELPYLRRAHEQYRDQGLVILSVSFDETRDSIKRLRGARWSMPWLSAFEPRGFAGESAKTFEIAGIPRPILIDPEGKIVAVDDELRGEALGRTLANVLARGPTETRRRD